MLIFMVDREGYIISTVGYYEIQLSFHQYLFIPQNNRQKKSIVTQNTKPLQLIQTTTLIYIQTPQICTGADCTSRINKRNPLTCRQGDETCFVYRKQTLAIYRYQYSGLTKSAKVLGSCSSADRWWPWPWPWSSWSFDISVRSMHQIQRKKEGNIR